MLKYFMPKLIYFFILLSVFLSSLFSVYAKEPTLAILNTIISNETQKLSIGNYGFTCEPYGVLTLEKLYNNATMDYTCQDKIKTFYIKHPDLEYYSSSILHIRQMYHIEFKGKECILYAKGQKVLSEILLEEGLAVKQPAFDDEEYNYLFSKAQNRAKSNKKGLFEDDTLSACIDSLYEE
ncbi:MAG: hypothetical protein AUK54_02540 [Helicobacteraceae bacterium CG2_30_36_10]|nr:MAG: hypothetical protein AUK54_02540 [Helicobacteraceae bacterium CG2_30_36_10]